MEIKDRGNKLERQRGIRQDVFSVSHYFSFSARTQTVEDKLQVFHITFPSEPVQFRLVSVVKMDIGFCWLHVLSCETCSLSSRDYRFSAMGTSLFPPQHITRHRHPSQHSTTRQRCLNSAFRVGLAEGRLHGTRHG